MPSGAVHPNITTNVGVARRWGPSALINVIVVMDSGLAHRAPRNDEGELCPSGCGTMARRARFCASHRPQISGLSAPSRALSEGRIMVVTKRWRGMRWTQAVSKDERYRCGRQSRGSWRPTLASSLRSNLQATVANKPDHRGERGISRKPLCRGCPGASAEPVCSCAPLLPLRMRPRVQRAPGIPCALWLWRGKLMARTRAICVARMRSHIHHRRHSGARLFLGASPESIQPRSLRPNEFRFRAARAPGMTTEKATGASRNDEGGREACAKGRVGE